MHSSTGVLNLALFERTNYVRPIYSAVGQLQMPPALREIPCDATSKSKANLRRENREILQTAVVAKLAESQTIAPKVPCLEMESCPWVNFAVHYNKKEDLLILAAKDVERGKIVYGCMQPNQARGHEQELSLADLRSLVELRELLIKEHGSKLRIN